MRFHVPVGRGLLLVAVLTGVVRADQPQGTSLARYFPRQDLIAYVEFDGFDAHIEAWKKTAAARILGETPSGAMLANVARQVLSAVLPKDQERSPTAEIAAEIASELTRFGFAFAINRKADDPSAKPSCIGLVFRNGGRGPLVQAMKTVLAASGADEKTLTTLEKPEGRKLTVIGPAEGPCVAWWVEKDDLVFSILATRYADAMIAALEGREPSAVEHPSRLELARKVDGFEPVTLAFLDTTALPEMPPDAAAFGLDGLKRIDFQWGFQGEALVSHSRFLAPEPRRGVLAMFDQPTFEAKSLPPLPEGVGTFTTISVNLVQVVDQIGTLIKIADPVVFGQIAGEADAFRAATGVRIREDILAQLGPKLVFADVPTQISVSADRLGGFIQSMARVPRMSLLIELPDRAKFLKDLETLATWANAQFPLPKDLGAKPDRPAPLLIRRLKNIANGYEVALSPTYWPLPTGYRPSIVVGERYAALGTSPAVAKEALRADGDLGAPLIRALSSLPKNLTALSVVDTRNSGLAEILANVPSMIQWWALAIPQGLGNPVLGNLTPTPPGLMITDVVPVIPAAGGEVTPTPIAPLAPGVPVDTQPPPTQPVTKPDAVAVASGEVKETVVLPSPSSSPPGLPPPIQMGNVTFSFTGFQPIPPGQFRLRFDPDEIPTPDEIRPFLFAATHSLSSDAQGFRITSRESFPSLNPMSLAPLAVSAALPAFQHRRSEKQKERLAANLRQIGLGLSSYHDANNRYPMASTVDHDGKPLLSWRVQILPFLGQLDLYNEFHHDEPWDSPHNKTLVERMPTAFAHPDEKPGPGLTFYRGLIGKSLFFDPEVKEGVSIAMVTDGTSNTLSIVEAKEAVPWTKPGTEIAVNPLPPPSGALNLLPKLGGHIPGGFQILLIDGSVRFVSDSVNLTILNGLMTRDFGEVISADAF